MATALSEAKHSLVVAGGTPTSGAQAKNCSILANAINYLLGNVGNTVKIYPVASAYASKSSNDSNDSNEQLQKLTQQMSAKDSNIGTLEQQCVV